MVDHNTGQLFGHEIAGNYIALSLCHMPDDRDKRERHLSLLRGHP